MKIGSVVVRHLGLLALFASGVFASAPSRAVPAFTVDINAGGAVLSLTQADFTCTQGGTVCSDSGLSAGGMQFDLGFNVNTDPSLSASVSVLNNSGGTQQFTALFTATGVGTSGNLTLTEGGISGGATSNTKAGATLAAPAGSAFYTALIDGAKYLPLLYPNPFSLPVPASMSANFADASFGPNQPGPAIVDSVGIKLDFTLTDQDSASMSGTFNLKPVPEPGTALLLGVGLVLMARRERRR